MKITIDVSGLAKTIIDILAKYHGLYNFIIIDESLLFILKFWFLLYYFLKIKWKFSTLFHPQINGQIKRQNSIIEAYLRVFMNWK